MVFLGDREGEDGELVMYQIELPEDQADVKLHHAMIVMLNGNPGISNVVNTSGGHVYRAGEIARLLNWPMISESDKR